MSTGEYLVRISVHLPADMAANQRAALADAERRRGSELIAVGAITRIWRLPGRSANVGIWRADSATELHQLISSLPLHPWMIVDVEAIAFHPLEAAA